MKQRIDQIGFTASILWTIELGCTAGSISGREIILLEFLRVNNDYFVIQW